MLGTLAPFGTIAPFLKHSTLYRSVGVIEVSRGPAGDALSRASVQPATSTVPKVWGGSVAVLDRFLVCNHMPSARLPQGEIKIYFYFPLPSPTPDAVDTPAYVGLHRLDDDGTIPGSRGNAAASGDMVRAV